ncbi:hypothetical protein SCHPADRAFT_659298 [Schizopora paradoxa]|uniref:Uncharacterized protein n=1 Tax=Schizopora paradoxa TaxID=27342 RepID=A0A0H2R5W6_9AGAM|nr:hypothetical protein SCHPADRAFT_659298 [Schizopora paradoxa]
MILGLGAAVARADALLRLVAFTIGAHSPCWNFVNTVQHPPHSSWSSSFITFYSGDHQYRSAFDHIIFVLEVHDIWKGNKSHSHRDVCGFCRSKVPKRFSEMSSGSAENFKLRSQTAPTTSTLEQDVVVVVDDDSFRSFTSRFQVRYIRMIVWIVKSSISKPEEKISRRRRLP